MAIEHVTSSGNVFADLGLSDPEGRLVKSKLAAALQRSMGELGLTQTAASARMGMPQPKLSNLLRGLFRGFSERRLMNCLTRLGRDVQIVVKATPRSRSDGRLSVVFV